jgi:DNA repair exonuclease SbcCD nuclease subunit
MTLRRGSDVLIVHSSDLHLEHDYTVPLRGGNGTAALSAVLSVARACEADVLVLAGDTFDSHRLPVELVERAAGLISAAGLPIVLLPGNHDPVVSNSIYVQRAISRAANLHVIGVTHEEAVVFDDLELEVWGRAHRGYGDMIPLEHPRQRSTRWQVVLAHGHYMPLPDRATPLRPSWLIGDDELAATNADYIALGHWNRPATVGGVKKAYYCGSPGYAGTVNIVRLTAMGRVEIHRTKLDATREPGAID